MQRLQKIFENAPLLFDVFDENGNFIFVNHEFTNTLGWTLQDLISQKNPLSIFFDEKKQEKHAEEFIHNGIGKFEIWKLKTKDGQTRTQEWANFKFEDFVVGIGRDITDSHKMEQKLKESETLFQTLFENAPVLMNGFDETGKMILANREFIKTFGWTLEEIYEFKEPMKVFYPEDEVENIKKYISEGKGEFHDFNPITKNGEIRNQKWADFKIDGITIGLGIDLTDDLKIQEKLKESTKQLELALEAAQGGIWVWRYGKGVDENKWDDQTCIIHGIDPGKYPKSNEEFKKMFNITENRRIDPYYSEYKIETPNGPRYIASRGRVFDFKNGIETKTGVCLDITERREQEAKLEKAKEEAELANKSKSEFLSIISHEIRNPMNVVLGMAQLLKDTDLNPVQQQYVANLTNSSELLLSLIGDVLDLSKIESGKMELNEEIYNLQSIFEYLKDILESKVKSNIKINVYLDNGLPTYVNGDKEKIKQILTNLTNNSIKFTKSGEIDIGCKILQQQKDSCVLHFYVRDTGIGIKKEDQENILKPFVQIDKSTSGKYGGVGLGLTICDKILKTMGSNLCVESIYGKGTTMSFSIEVKKVNHVNQKNGDMENEDFKQHLNFPIIIAEDNLMSQEVLWSFLKSFGFSGKCKKLRNGNEVLKELEKEQYNLIFMDISMQEKDGIQTTKEIIEKYGEKRPYIIAVTAHAMTGDKEKFLNSGMDDYIKKPIQKDELKEVLFKFIKIK